MSSMSTSQTHPPTNHILPPRIRTRPFLLRFFIKYRCFIIPLGLFFLVHFILSISLAFLYTEEVEESRFLRTNSTAKNTAFKDALDLTTLSFTPTCTITAKEAISAIRRAKTQACKEQLAKTACKIVDGSLYKERLPRYCFNNYTSYLTHIGCFRDDKNNRILSDSFTLLKSTNSPLNCVDLCLQSGYQYAGVQYGVECFCGNTSPSTTLKLPSSECSMKCPGYSHDSCGGYFAMDIFETGIYNGPESKPKLISLETPTDNPSSKIRIVYFLTLNGRSSRQVFRLVKALFHQRHYFYIHVDSRQDYLYRQMLHLAHILPNNVKLVADRKGAIWGGASLLTVLLEGMKDLIMNKGDWNWDYVINLSESDFPLKTTSHLEHFLSLNKGKNFLKSHGREALKFIQKQGLDKTFDECEYRMWRVGDRKLPAGILIDGGSDWVALHRDFVSYVVINEEDELVRGLREVFRHTLLPAESFFHTLLLNSEHCPTFIDNNLHVTNWRRKLGCKCQYRNIVDWCGCSPNDFRMSDWNRLKSTSTRLLFFARKFEPIVEQSVINQLEHWLYPDRSQTNLPTLDRFWMSLYHYHDLCPKPDDALVTLGRSLSRIAWRDFRGKHLSKMGLDDRVEALEITCYNHRDVKEGVLVRFRVGEGLVVEAWFKQLVKVEKGAVNPRTLGYQKRMQNPQISSDYDQKEQIFRNYHGALGPFSEPSLTFQSDDSLNITVAWIDPRNILRAVSNMTTNAGVTANFIKPELKGPLDPGKWTVKLYTVEGDLIYRVGFLIIPLEAYGGSMGMEGIHPSPDSDIPEDESSQESIDTLVSEFYLIQDYCLEEHLHLRKDSEGMLPPPEISLCTHTQWSSLYPDPKSMIEGIDPDTGLLLP